ncbi:RL23 [Hepatospora eriocheir]|uniref:RL23 n=1 Tax=Hepatospora eriocheir TaxID=1081669 RepID=A0A1X0Q8M1_9MICR|nr:RL23 [Hepatospora eriocheir]
MVKVRATNKSLSIKDRYNGRKKTVVEKIAPIKQMYPRNIFKNETDKSAGAILKYILKNERTTRCMERDNTLVYIVDVNATKIEIKAAITEKYNQPVKKVRTLIMFKEYAKKAFVVFKNPEAALEIAGKANVL